jgi:hypothetical protein
MSEDRCWKATRARKRKIEIERERGMSWREKNGTYNPQSCWAAVEIRHLWGKRRKAELRRRGTGVEL